MSKATRRDFIKMAGAAVLAGGCATASSRGANPRSFPHIVYILADDLGYGDVGCLNPESKIPTPNIDRLGRGGVVFTDAHSGSAVCTPTRYGVLTGRYCWRSPLKSSVLEGYSRALMDEKRMTVASLLKSRGYHTACVGKWHLGLNWQLKESAPGERKDVNYARPLTGGPTAVGFDYFYGIPASLDMPPYVYVENDRVVAAPDAEIAASEKPAYYRGGPVAPGFQHGEVLPVLTRKAVDVIDRHAAEHSPSPLFLYFPLTAPHTPIMPSRAFAGKSGIGPYGDFVCEVDWAVGEILAALEHNQMADNTLVIFTSDNGCAPMVGLEALRALGHDPCAHFRGHKADIYEGGHRIPLVASWPARIRPGGTCDHLVCLTDLLATAAGIVGAPLPDNAGEDSVSMLPALLGAAEPAREAIVHHSVGGAFSIRQGVWKLEFCPGSGGWSYPKPDDPAAAGLPPVQLYNIKDDPAESHNVQDKHPEIVQRLTELMQKYIDDGRSTPGAPQQNEGRTSLWGPGGKK